MDDTFKKLIEPRCIEYLGNNKGQIVEDIDDSSSDDSANGVTFDDCEDMRIKTMMIRFEETLVDEPLFETSRNQVNGKNRVKMCACKSPKKKMTSHKKFV